MTPNQGDPMSEKPGVWRDATEADIGKTLKAIVRDSMGVHWHELGVVTIVQKCGQFDWLLRTPTSLFRYRYCQVFDETPAAQPEPEWQEPTVEMVGREVVAQFRDRHDHLWGADSKGVLLCKFGETAKLWSTQEKGVAWYYQCRVKPLDTTKAEEPKAEASKAATDDGWRDAVWPDDWGMACRVGEEKEFDGGYLVGYDPLTAYPWVVTFSTDPSNGPMAQDEIQVNDRLPRFVMPGGGK